MVQDVSVMSDLSELVRQKEALRREAVALRDALPAAERAAAADAVAARTFPVTLAAGIVVSGFMPIKSEINPVPLLRRLAERRREACAACRARARQPLSMRAWHMGEPLAAGVWGIREPQADAPEVDPDILLVPLLAFDRRGHRLGYGAGFFDMTHRRIAQQEKHRRRRHCLCGAGGRRGSGHPPRRPPRSRANRARDHRSAEQLAYAHPLHRGHCRPQRAHGRAGAPARPDPRLALDFVVINGENAAGGFGITEAIYQEFIDAGADAVTLGNHAWDQREALVFIERAPKLMRPINYPPGTPGRGAALIEAKNGARVLVINAMGRVFMDPLDDPFARDRARTVGLRARSAAPMPSSSTFNAEATSEKQAMGHFCDGRASLVVGTHTHAPTADHQILAGGTAFMSDAGMTGDYDSVIGMDKEEPLNRFLRRIPRAASSRRTGEATFCGARGRNRRRHGPRAARSRRCGSAGGSRGASAIRAPESGPATLFRARTAAL